VTSSTAGVRQAAGWRAWGVAIGGLVAAAVFWQPAFRSLQATGLWDWQYFHHMWETGYVAWKRFGEWALWDPYHCGGVTLFGNPQSQVLAPFYFLSFLVGPTPASKLWVVLHAAAGFSGAWLFARRAGGLGPRAAALVSVAWAASGYFAWHGARGHSAFMPFYYLPWLLLAWRAAEVDRRFAAAVAALLALVLLEGGVYPFAFFVLVLAFEMVTGLVQSRRRTAVLQAGAVTLALTALLGAIRLLPILDEVRRYRRRRIFADSLTPSEVLEMLTAREHDLIQPGHPYLWTEFGSYVGWGVLALATLGALLAWRRGRFSWAVGLAVFTAFLLGDHGPLSPWALLQRLPLYGSLRVPSRLAVLVTFHLALLAGLGLQVLEDAAARRLGRGSRARLVPLAAGALVALLALDLFAASRAIVDEWRGLPIRRHAPAQRYYLDGEREYLRWYASFPGLGVGATQCYEPMRPARATGLWTGPGPQVRIVGATGRVFDWGRSVNRAFAEVRLDAPGTLVFNQNHAPGWRSSRGRVYADVRGRLAVEAPPGRYRVELRYRPRTLWPGLLLSGLGLVASVLVVRRPGASGRAPPGRLRLRR
jgi:hypothetical protein